MSAESGAFIQSGALQLGAQWGTLIFLTVISSAVIHGLFGLVASWKLALARDLRFLFVPLLYFLVGVVYSLAMCSLIAFAVACVNYTLSSPLDNSEMVAYVVILVAVTTFFASGRTSTLYAL
jgi:hypothetical protein